MDELCKHIENGDISVVQDLVARLSVNITDHSSQGFTPLATAIIYEQTEITKYLLKQGADVHLGYKKEWRAAKQREPEAGLPSLTDVAIPLSLAATKGSKLVELLASSDVNINTQFDGGKTALHVAGGDVNVADQYGWTPLIFTISRQEFEQLKHF